MKQQTKQQTQTKHKIRKMVENKLKTEFLLLSHLIKLQSLVCDEHNLIQIAPVKANNMS